MEGPRRGGVRAARRGIPWVATNTDWTLPLARGTAPGNGTLVSAVHTAVGILPVVAGKPEVAIYDEAMTRYGSRAALMIGDRLDTDIKGANRAGIPSVQVLTGIDQAKQVLAAVPDERPTFILDDLRGLHEPYPATVVDGEVTTVGTAAVRLAGNRLTAERGAGIDLLRAASTAIWSSGKPDLRARRGAGAIFVTVDDETEQPAEAVDAEARADADRDDETDALLSRLRLIEDQPLGRRAAAFTQVHDELRSALEGGDSPGHHG